MEEVSLLGVGVYIYCNAYQVSMKLSVITSIILTHSPRVFKELYDESNCESDCSLDVKTLPQTLTNTTSSA